MDDVLTLLTRANAREVLAAFKLDRLGCLQPLADWLASFPARRLSRQILRFDDLVGRRGLAAAGRYILDEFTGSARIEGQRHVPSCGPVLAVANHPGMVDAMAIWVALECRRDLKIIAAEREILRLIPNIRSRLLFVSPRTRSRSRLLRDATDHLRRGGALLTFPAGTIEPDPSVRVVDAPAGWSDSSELLVRLVPETLVLPIAVSGVISSTAHRHRIARCFADPKEREWAAATLQVLCRHLRDTRTRVVIGEPIPSGRFSQRAAICAAMASLLARVNNGCDENVATSDDACHGIAMGPVSEEGEPAGSSSGPHDFHTTAHCHNSIQLRQSCARVLSQSLSRHEAALSPAGAGCQGGRLCAERSR
ncbi:MAG TPA: 1-acyl-sn-glycerol-3-phosphate acyltransferase [Hyphomicrobiaceae bacterium]|jgi:1-acyl-sn-glycerol-3-phosphate acyltransferase